MDEIEQGLLHDVQKHMERLAKNMETFDGMHGAYAYKRSKELYEELAKLMAKLNK